MKLANTTPVLNSPNVTSDSVVPAIKSAPKPRTVAPQSSVRQSTCSKWTTTESTVPATLSTSQDTAAHLSDQSNPMSCPRHHTNAASAQAQLLHAAIVEME